MNRQIKALFFEEVCNAAIAKAVAALPFLGIPGVYSIFSFVVTKVGGLIYEELSLRITFQLIDSHVGAEKDEFDNAKAELERVLTLEQHIQDPSPENSAEIQRQIDEAKAKFKEKLASLIRIKP